MNTIPVTLAATSDEQVRFEGERQPLVTSPILEELYRIRDDHAAAYGNDFSALVADLMSEQDRHERNGYRVVRLPILRAG